ncbi:ABC transporter substrate-binding protein [Sediminispirochaeta smaragdinae]|uniref:Extracellular solute-binding protein family 1 n=1 Tax=Sediminispirochaeta smaragdinae (strain DSM 11293 / JCM 15392 / SEBR 4228) TaxID=573413 RepID=E1R6G3_SEDSS|nr:ABC transporter substrate-binding protein [Sediminispirochaeta smaragdinae]ADK80981.1 extracellular solute-binding protein family 1 [Sediminispirochaeta smaragdinae DSM 11293]
MKHVKRLGILAVILLLVFAFSSCSNSKSEEGTASISDGKSWEETSGFHDKLSVEELYEKAKEEKTVTIYSMSSRLNDVKESFEAQYPGVEVVVYDMRNSEILEKFQREYNAGIHTADVLFIKDTDGAVYNEFVKMGLLKEYIPQNMMKSALPEYQKGAYVPYFEMKQIFYNSEVYDSCPIDNWWDLTRPEYNGKIILRSPIENSEIMGLFIAFVKNSDDMASAYEKEFGEKLVLNGTEHAGYEFLKRLINNDLIIMTSDTDITEAVGAPGQSDPPFGIATSSKMRKAGDDLLINVANDLLPRLGVLDPAYLYITDQSEHVNAAKLLLRWIGGEADGTGEGFKPFHVRGSWPSRTDVAPIDTPPLNSLNLWPLDLNYNYMILDDMRNFWLTLQ